ncbi:MAG TPA: ATPase, T2SS/T4P/T4SS family [Acidimicrobiia bacterium]|nr:ATPase, T2SS/T4P/T4SS family [Acidimicrobiia bacterium]
MSQQYSRWQDLQKAPSVTRAAQLEELRQRVHQYVIEQVGPMLTDERVREHELRGLVHEHVNKALVDEKIALSAAERAQLMQDVTDDTIGYGPVDRFLHDPGITEVMCNGPKDVYIERRGKIERTDVEFVDEGHLRRTIDKIVAQVGRRIDESAPMVDARLPDGSRVNAVIHPVAIGGPFLTIRKFAKDPYTIGDLISFGSITPQVAHFIDACVRGRLNVVVSGGTGTGKTTLLNVFSSFIPHDERIVTIEDA